MVGWIRLHTLGHDQLRGELLFVEAKRLVRRGRRRLGWVGKAFELHVWPRDSRKSIRSELLASLRELEHEIPCKGRYIDLECFEEASKFIDWHALLRG